MMQLVERDGRIEIDGSFDSNWLEEICIDLNSSEERHSLTQRRERTEGHRANRKARQKTL
jgi:hypothetical protein